MNRTDRLLGILLELQARGERRAVDLAQTFEVSVRTVYRDVQAIAQTGVPVVATPGKGYRLMEGYFLPPLSFTADEASALVLGGEFVGARVDPELRRAADDAVRKLVAVLPPDRRAAVDRRRRARLCPSFGRAADDPRLAPLRAAIGERQAVRLLYHALRRPGPEERVVEPVSLVYFHETWYLAAYCRRRRASRLFRLDRVDRLDLLDERFELSERHAVGPEPAEARPSSTEIRVRFDPSVERWVRECQPWGFIREEPDPAGTVFVYALRDERALLGWLLSWGAAAELLEPPDLRARLVQEARAILERHADPDSPAHNTSLEQEQNSRSTPATTLSAALR